MASRKPNVLSINCVAGSRAVIAQHPVMQRFFKPFSLPFRIESPGIGGTAKYRQPRAVQRNFLHCRHEFLVAIDVEERRERGLPLVRLASPVEPEWLLDQAIERIALEWNRAAERVEQVSALLYDQLVIEETREPAPASEETSRVLATKALEVDIGPFVGCQTHFEATARPHPSPELRWTWSPVCKPCGWPRHRVSPNCLSRPACRAAAARLDQLAPERLTLSAAAGQSPREPGKPP